MKHLLLLIIVSVSTNTNAAQDYQDITNRKISFSPAEKSKFGILAEANGILNVKNHDVTIDLSEILFIHNPEYNYIYNILSYDVCVAYYENDEGVWNLEKCSQKRYPIQKNIQPGKIIVIPNHSFRIRHVPKLNEKWLVIIIYSPVGTFFSHSEKHIFEIDENN